MLKKSILIIFLLLQLMISYAYSENFNVLNRSDFVNLPEDLFYKDNFVSQWWYFTGHLESEDGKLFGFEVTFFVINVNQKKFKSPFGLQKAYMLHSAITDISDKHFYYNSEISRGAFDSAGVLENSTFVWLNNSYLKGDIDKFHIFSESQDFSINLKLKSIKKPVKNGQNGYSQKVDNCSKCASLYFSITRLLVDGTVKLNKKNYKVKGLAWFDREINSDYDASTVKGWDWFSIQLDNGVDIMLYLIRDNSGNIQKVSSGTIVYPDGTYKILLLEDFSVKPLKYYRSKKSDAKYPSKWRIKILSEKLDLILTPLLKDQELVSRLKNFPTYWEGACKVEGNVSGKAYVELTGYGEDS